MSDANQATLTAYGERTQAYVDGTPQELTGAPRDWIDAALDGLKPQARILELGSAFGRDAAYVAARGFRIQCTDAVESFLAILRARGFDARPFNALTDELAETYDLILANAVLLHFDRTQFAAVLTKICKALKPGGRFAFSLKKGEGEGWSSEKIGAPRYFCYWRAEDLPPALAAAGFDGWKAAEGRTNRAHVEWIYVIAQSGAAAEND